MPVYKAQAEASRDEGPKHRPTSRPSTLRAGLRAPLILGRMGRVQGQFHVLGCGLSHLADRLRGSGAQVDPVLAHRRRQPLPADEVLIPGLHADKASGLPWWGVLHDFLPPYDRRPREELQSGTSPAAHFRVIGGELHPQGTKVPVAVALALALWCRPRNPEPAFVSEHDGRRGRCHNGRDRRR